MSYAPYIKPTPIKIAYDNRGNVVAPSTLQSLRGLRRWRSNQKKVVLCAIEGGVISPEAACEQFALTEEELAGWSMRSPNPRDVEGLCITRRQRTASVLPDLPSLKTDVLWIGKLHVNLETRVVEVGGESLHFPQKEWELFELFLRYRDKTVSVDMVLDRLYTQENEPVQKMVTVLVYNLRKKICEATGEPGESYIKTVWGRGYMLKDPYAAAEAA